MQNSYRNKNESKSMNSKVNILAQNRRWKCIVCRCKSQAKGLNQKVDGYCQWQQVEMLDQHIQGT